MKSSPLSPDFQGAVMGLNGPVKRWDDIAPEFAAVARRFELQAHAAKAQGHDVTASDASLRLPSCTAERSDPSSPTPS